MSHSNFRNFGLPVAFVLAGLTVAPVAAATGDTPASAPHPASDATTSAKDASTATTDAGDTHGRSPRNKPAADESELAAEWVELEKFMQVHSPHKWQMYHSLPDRAVKQTLKKQILQRYRTLQRVEKSDPVRWKMEIEAIGIEDEIYRILRELRNGNEAEMHERRLRVEVDRLVANRDGWRRERLLRVKAELESLKLTASLGPVEAEIERLDNATPEARAVRVDKRIEDFKKHADKPPRALIHAPSPASELLASLEGA